MRARHIPRGLLAAPAALGLALALVTPAAAEDDAPYSFGTVPGWTVLGGVTGGGSFGTGDPGGFVGLELSVNRLSEAVWSGLYADGTWDFGRDEVIATAGPQLGYYVLGLDGGAALRVRDGESDVGVGGRLLIALAVFDLYGRYVHFFEGDAHLWQVGAMIKWPLWAEDTEDKR